MIHALCANALGDARWLLAGFAALMFFFPWLNIWVSSMISMPALGEFLANALPKRWERISGVPFSEIATPAGRIALVYIHPLMVFGATVWAIARGSDCVSGEIGRGTMEMLLAQPVRRTTVYATQALVTISGSAVLASAAWCGTAVGLGMVTLSEPVSAARFIAPALNLFGLMVCLGGMSAMASSWGSQRWRTVGLVGAWYVLSTLLTLASRIADGWQWVSYTSFLRAYKPQSMVARPDEAWSLWVYQDGAVADLGLGGQQILLLTLGLLCYVMGAVIFSRREIPAPL